MIEKKWLNILSSIFYQLSFIVSICIEQWVKASIEKKIIGGMELLSRRCNRDLHHPRPVGSAYISHANAWLVEAGWRLYVSLNWFR